MLSYVDETWFTSADSNCTSVPRVLEAVATWGILSAIAPLVFIVTGCPVATVSCAKPMKFSDVMLVATAGLKTIAFPSWLAPR